MTSHLSTNRPPSARNPWLAAVLAFLFGPFGLLYSSVVLSIFAFLLVVPVVYGLFATTGNLEVSSLSLGVLFAIIAFYSVKNRNEKYRATAISRLDNPSRLKAVIVGILGLGLLWLLVSSVAGTTSGTKYTMRPTFDGTRRYLVIKSPLLRGKLLRGQVILYKTPGDHPLTAVTRVAALPGDIVEMRNGLLYINGQPGDDPQLLKNLKSSPSCLKAGIDVNQSSLAVLGFNDQKQAKILTIPKGYVYVLADNRGENVEDSRFFGPLPIENVLGVLRVPKNSPTNVDCTFQR